MVLILIEINQDGEIENISNHIRAVDNFTDFIMVDVVYKEKCKEILTERY